MSNNLNKEIENILQNRLNKSKNSFSLTNINFGKIYNNLLNSRKGGNIESNTKQIDNKQIVLNLRYEVRKKLYKLIDGNKSEVMTQNNNKMNNSDSYDNNWNMLGKKRNFEIPIIDITEE